MTQKVYVIQRDAEVCYSLDLAIALRAISLPEDSKLAVLGSDSYPEIEGPYGSRVCEIENTEGDFDGESTIYVGFSGNSPLVLVSGSAVRLAEEMESGLIQMIYVADPPTL